jgi:hypothetical protein
MIANPALVWIFMNIFTFPFTMIFRWEENNFLNLLCNIYKQLTH